MCLASRSLEDALILDSQLGAPGFAAPIYLTFITVRWKKYLYFYQADVVWVEHAAVVF